MFMPGVLDGITWGILGMVAKVEEESGIFWRGFVFNGGKMLLSILNTS